MKFSSVEAVMPKDSLIPEPVQDHLGLRLDPIYMAKGEDDQGEVFVAVHSRPFEGGPLHMLIEEVMPVKHTHWVRKHSSSILKFPDNADLGPYEDGSQSHNNKMQRIHSAREGASAIGDTYVKFSRDARRSWVDRLAVEDADAVYAPLTRMRIIDDFPPFADASIERWVDDKLEIIVGDIGEFTLPGLNKVLTQKYIDRISQTRSGSTHWADVQMIQEGPAWFDDREQLVAYLGSLNEQERTDLVGQFTAAYSWEHGRSRPANRLLVDPSNADYWYHAPQVYDPNIETPAGIGMIMDETQHPFPDIELRDDRTMTISHGAMYADFEFFDSERTSSGLDYRVTSYKDHEGAAQNGMHPGVAWRQLSDGSREFFDFDTTQRLVEEARIPVEGSVDTYLGKIMLRYYRQEGELEEDVGGQKWLSRMGLPGTDRKVPILQREVAVWTSLPQHASDLLSTEFVEGVELSLS